MNPLNWRWNEDFQLDMLFVLMVVQPRQISECIQTKLVYDVRRLFPSLYMIIYIFGSCEQNEFEYKIKKTKQKRSTEEKIKKFIIYGKTKSKWKIKLIFCVCVHKRMYDYCLNECTIVRFLFVRNKCCVTTPLTIHLRLIH